MALVFADGFDGYPSTVSALRYGWANNISISTAAGKWGGGAHRPNQYNNARAYAQTPRFNITTNDIRIAFWFAAGSALYRDASTGSSVIYLFQLFDLNRQNSLKFSLSDINRPEVSWIDGFNQNYTTRFSVNTGTVGSLGDDDAQWHHYEYRFIASNTTTGLVQCWIDGELVMDHQNVITCNTAHPTAVSQTAIDFKHAILSWPGRGALQLNVDFYAYWDDFMIWDNAGPEMNTASRLGPHRIRSLFPRANGTYQQFGGFANTGGNWNAVDSVDDDTSYAEDGTVGDKDSYLITAIPGNPTKIPAITLRAHAKNPDVGSKQYTLFVKSGSAEVNSNSYVMNVTTAYTYGPNALYPIVYHTNPDGGVAWTAGSLANTEVGVKVEL